MSSEIPKKNYFFSAKSVCTLHVCYYPCFFAVCSNTKKSKGKCPRTYSQAAIKYPTFSIHMEWFNHPLLRIYQLKLLHKIFYVAVNFVGGSFCVKNAFQIAPVFFPSYRVPCSFCWRRWSGEDLFIILFCADTLQLHHDCTESVKMSEMTRKQKWDDNDSSGMHNEKIDNRQTIISMASST